MRATLMTRAATTSTTSVLHSAVPVSGNRPLSERINGVAAAQISQAAAVVRKTAVQSCCLPRAAMPPTTCAAVIRPTATQTMAIHQECRVSEFRRSGIEPTLIYARSGSAGGRCSESTEICSELIQRRLFEAVDDEDLDRPAPALQLQPQLLLQSGKEVRRVGISRWRQWVRAGQRASREAKRCGLNASEVW